MMKIHEVTALLSVIAVGCGFIGASPSVSAAVSKQTESPIVSKCKEDLAKRFKLQVRDIKVIENKDVTWPDASLGMPEIDKMYAQVLTPGLRLILEAKSSKYLYTTSEKAFKYGGPVSSWAYSTLYLKPNMNDANLNGDLYQCSLLGTNPVRVCSEVTDFYPQDKGMVIVKRRTSRSGHELLYVKADGKAKAKPIYSAFDFGNAAFNSAQTEWAGFVRPSLGLVWNIVVAPIGDFSDKAKTLPLPEDVKSGQIAWSGEKVMILVKTHEFPTCYEISPKDAKPVWKAVGPNLFPGLTNYMLNKSESLEIRQIDENGKPSVEVARVWFTGDRNIVAKISNLTLTGEDLFGSSAMIWGQKGSESAAYAVDIYTGEVIPGFHGTSLSIRPFNYPPYHGPLGSAK